MELEENPLGSTSIDQVVVNQCNLHEAADWIVDSGSNLLSDA
jgi:hypothetical protein